MTAIVSTVKPKVSARNGATLLWNRAAVRCLRRFDRMMSARGRKAISKAVVPVLGTARKARF